MTVGLGRGGKEIPYMGQKQSERCFLWPDNLGADKQEHDLPAQPLLVS